MDNALSPILSTLYDLRLLGRFAAAAAQADAAAPPSWQRLTPEDVPSPRRLGLLAGSFNPPTDAHLALAAAALQSDRMDQVALTVSKVTVDKEAVTRASLTDRLLLLHLIVSRLNADAAARQRDGTYSVALVNRGLYADQARAVRAALPHLDDLLFVVGFDKIVQVLDPRYYVDREAALTGLFQSATFLVAGRAGRGSSDLQELLGRPENRRYRPYVSHLALPSAYADHSSSAVRGSDRDVEALTSYVPPEVETFLDEAQPYSPPQQQGDGSWLDTYGTRLALLEQLLSQHATLSPMAVRQHYRHAMEREVSSG